MLLSSLAPQLIALIRLTMTKYYKERISRTAREIIKLNKAFRQVDLFFYPELHAG